MGIFRRKPKKPEAPLLYKGELLEQQLFPFGGWQEERFRVLGDSRARNFWCTFRDDTQANGKYAGSSLVRVVVNGVVVGELPAFRLVKRPELIEALNSGINTATVFLSTDGFTASAVLRLGDHKYMPKPYWL